MYGVRKTCSDACFKAVLQLRSTYGVRSASKRETRRKQARSTYRRKDKADVVRELTARQQGKCDICGGAGCLRGDGSHGLLLDHCHVTGEPRAMLCARCNAAVGQVRESPEIVRSLLTYVTACSLLSGKSPDVR